MSKPLDVVEIGEDGNPRRVQTEKVEKSDAEWRAELAPDEFAVARQKGTERAFTGRYWNNHEAGMYKCVCCGTPLFRSDEKFESGTGWPSFWAPAAQENVATESDDSLFMRRTEVLCSKCDAHFGHLDSLISPREAEARKPKSLAAEDPAQQHRVKQQGEQQRKS